MYYAVVLLGTPYLVHNAVVWVKGRYLVYYTVVWLGDTVSSVLRGGLAEDTNLVYYAVVWRGHGS